MPLLFVAFGLFMLIAAVKGGDSMDKAITLLKGDFTGKNSFLVWLVALFAVGAVGYIKPLRPLSVAFLTLVMIVLFLSNKGFFKQFQEQIQS